MKKQAERFSGINIAIITCFDTVGQFNPDAQRKLIRFLIEKHNPAGITVCASTGEGLLLNDDEYWAVATVCLKEMRAIDPKKIVLLSTTHFDPRVTVARNRKAQTMGFDGVLISHPPYSKPDQRGIAAYFKHLAKEVPGLPIIIYNIWYRTGGKGIDAETIIALAKVPEIIGVKNAGVSIEHTDAVIKNTVHEDFIYLCGEDDTFFDCLTHGAHGAITAAGNCLGKEMAMMQAYVQSGELKKALEISRQIAPMIDLLFAEPNPTAIKAALSLSGLDVGVGRLPFLPASEGLVEKLQKTLP